VKFVYSGYQPRSAALDPTAFIGLNVTTEISIREYRSEDKGEVVKLWATVFQDDPPWNAPELLIEQKLRVQPELLLVAVGSGTIANNHDIVAFYQSVGYEIEQRISMGRHV